MLTEKIREIHDRSRGTYGSPRVHAALQDEGIRVGKKRVARLMKAADLKGASRRKRPSTTTQEEGARPAPDLVERDFTAEEPDELWVADITCVPTDAGYLYLSVVLDAFSRRVVGWAMASRMRTELVLNALDMASEQRDPEETIHHSDQGSQYTAVAFGQRCEDAGVRPSMGSVGDCYDNALCESFFATRSLRPSNANSSSESPMRIDRRLASASSTSSKGGIIRTDCTQPLTISRR